MPLLRTTRATTKTARHPFKQHCTRGNSRLSLPMTPSQPKLQQRPPKTIVANHKRASCIRGRAPCRGGRAMRWTPSGGARIVQVSPVQFSRPHSRLQFEHCSRLAVSPLALSRIASSTATPPAGSAPGMGCCSSSPSMSAAAAAAIAMLLEHTYNNTNSCSNSHLTQ